MAELIEAMDVSKEWLIGVKDVTLTQLAIAFAMLALESKEKEVFGVLSTFIKTLKKFRTKEAKCLIDAIEEEIHLNWTERKSSNHVILM